MNNQLKKFCKEYGLRLRFTPAKGYFFNEDTGNFEKLDQSEKSTIGKSLEKAVQITSVIALFGGFILGYKGITGNVIGTTSSSNVLSTVLIILGIIGLVFSRKSKF